MRTLYGFVLALVLAVALALLSGCGAKAGYYCGPCRDATGTGPGACDAGLVCVRTVQQGGYLDNMPAMTCMRPNESSCSK